MYNRHNNLSFSQKHSGMSLIQLLVGIVIGAFVLLVAAQAYFVIKEKYAKAVNSMEDNRAGLAIAQALRTAIDDAGVPAPYGYWPWQSKTLRITGQTFNPLLYPPVYAATSITNFTPNGHVAGTDMLLVQGVVTHETTGGAITSGQTTISTALSIDDDDYVLLSDDQNHQLMRADSDSTGSQVTVSQGPSMAFAAGSFLARHKTMIFYLRQSGGVKDLFVNIDGATSGQEVVPYVDDFQIEYYINGSWQDVQNEATSGYVDDWYQAVKAVRVTYTVDNKSYSIVIAIKANNL